MRNSSRFSRTRLVSRAGIGGSLFGCLGRRLCRTVSIKARVRACRMKSLAWCCISNKKVSFICVTSVCLNLLLIITLCNVVYPPWRPTRLWLRDTLVNIDQLMDPDMHSKPTNTWSGYLTSDDVKALTGSRRTVVSRTGIECSALFRGKQEEIHRAEEYMRNNTPDLFTPLDYLRMSKNCTDFRKTRGYSPKPVSQEEEEFPIAFSILVYTNVQQVERLLRAIYAPQNYYCIHVDAKAPEEDHAAMAAITNCFSNVFVAPRPVEVHWGHISIMYAEMVCLQKLLNFKWKYFINLSGQMFPAHSNSELVQILKLYNGANDIEGSFERNSPLKFRVRTWLSWRRSDIFNTIVMTLTLKGRPPHNVTIYKGSNQVAISRAFAVYFLYSPKSQDIVEWFSDTFAPDEYIWPTINHNQDLRAPGSYKGDPETKVFTARASIWESAASYQKSWSWEDWKCQGKWIREICIFGVGDLPWLYRRPELFVNKFHSDFQWLAYDCTEELIFNRTIDDARSAATIGQQRFNLTYYRNLPFVRDSSLVTSLEESHLL